MAEKKIPLGSKVRAKAIGFTGTVLGRVHYMTGCDRYEVHPTVDKEGKIIDARMIEAGLLEVLDEPVLEFEKFPEEALIPMGTYVRDTISGWEGIVTGIGTYAVKSTQYQVTPEGLTDKHKPYRPLVFDGVALEILDQPKFELPNQAGAEEDEVKTSPPG